MFRCQTQPYTGPRLEQVDQKVAQFASGVVLQTSAGPLLVDDRFSANTLLDHSICRARHGRARAGEPADQEKESCD